METTESVLDVFLKGKYCDGTPGLIKTEKLLRAQLKD